MSEEIKINKKEEIDLVELAKVILQRWKFIAKYAIVAGIIGIIISFSIPKEYTTKIVFASESKHNSNNLNNLSGLASLAGINDISTNKSGLTEAIYPEIIKSPPFLLEFTDILITTEKGEQYELMDYLTNYNRSPWWNHIIKAPFTLISWITHLGKTEETKEEKKEIFDLGPTYREFIVSLSSRLNMEIDKKNNLINIEAKMQDPIVSALVADSMVTKLQRYMIDYQTTKVRQDLNYQLKLLTEAKKQYDEAEERLALATDRNRNITSEVLKVRIEKLKNERDLVYNIYNQTAQQVEYLKFRLQKETPIATIIIPAQIPERASSPNKKLITIGCFFLGIFIATGIIVVHQILLDPQKEELPN